MHLDRSCFAVEMIGVQAYAIPMKLKYDSSSKFAKDEPLWKTATTNFLRVVKECGGQIQRLSESL